jgi:hypothetical protein
MSLQEDIDGYQGWMSAQSVWTSTCLQQCSELVTLHVLLVRHLRNSDFHVCRAAGHQIHLRDWDKWWTLPVALPDPWRHVAEFHWEEEVRGRQEISPLKKSKLANSVPSEMTLTQRWDKNVSSAYPIRDTRPLVIHPGRVMSTGQRMCREQNLDTKGDRAKSDETDVLTCRGLSCPLSSDLLGNRSLSSIGIRVSLAIHWLHGADKWPHVVSL